ncbi:MAG: hypothetical protein [Caudoviricetes sp.]|nr:MAG: hypothetical protein [Caudoviricetes sp.]
MRFHNINGEEIMPWLTKQGYPYWDGDGNKVDWKGKLWRDPVRLTEDDIEKFDMYVKQHLIKHLHLSASITGRDTVYQRVQVTLSLDKTQISSADFSFPVRV